MSLTLSYGVLRCVEGVGVGVAVSLVSFDHGCGRGFVAEGGVAEGVG